MNKYQIFSILITVVLIFVLIFVWCWFVTFLCDFFALEVFGWQWYILSIAGIVGIFFQLTPPTSKQS
jgi:uncharacterized membrane protein